MIATSLFLPCLAYGENKIRIHYQRQNGNYEDFGVWSWGDVKEKSVNWPTGACSFNGKDKFGAYSDIELIANAKQINFLIVNKKNGEKDSGNKELKMDKNTKEIWIKEKDDKVYLSPEMQIVIEITSAKITDTDKILISLSCSAKEAISEFKENLVIKDSENNLITPRAIEALEGNQISVAIPLNMAKTPATITFKDKTILAQKSWQLIDKHFFYEGNDLGCTWHNGNPTLKLWAPRASKVEVFIFDKNDQTKTIGRKSLILQNKGVWSVDISANDAKGISDISGCFYQFEITNPGETPKRILDPYARSMAAVTVAPGAVHAGHTNDFLGKAAFIDPDKIGKTPRKVKIENYNKREDAIIYEIHVRDFTSDPSIKDQITGKWGSFKAFKSKLAYIKSLGVTHVQLLPVMAWYYGDETKMARPELHYSTQNNQYNWGYDPHNYFSLDGAYSENPNDPALRVAEFKELVDAIHAEGMGVILDVVYTHMVKANFLNDIVPNYYFFQDKNGNFLGDFGNNLATNHKMSEKLMVDSVKYWFQQYQIDGMRWDMMGDATSEAVQNAYDAAKEINPNCIFLGEGWRTFKGHIADPSLAGKAADQDWMDKTDSVGVFSDELRNELKSGFGCEGQPMFLTGGKRNINKIFKNIKAQPDNTPADSPGDMVQYIAAHDNLPLYDVIAQSIKKDPAIAENDLEIHRRVRIGNAMILLSQGTAFLHAGQEYGRTKQWKTSGKPEHKYHEFADENGKPFEHPYFIHDSYDSTDAINMFDWTKALNVSKFPINSVTRKYTTGLIALRRSSDAFHLGSKELVDKNVTLIKAPEIENDDLVIAIKAVSTSKETFYVFINADNVKREISLKTDLTDGKVLVDREQAGTKELTHPNGVTLLKDKIILKPLTVTVIKM